MLQYCYNVTMSYVRSLTISQSNQQAFFGTIYCFVVHFLSSTCPSPLRSPDCGIEAREPAEKDIHRDQFLLFMYSTHLRLSALAFTEFLYKTILDTHCKGIDDNCRGALQLLFCIDLYYQSSYFFFLSSSTASFVSFSQSSLCTIYLQFKQTSFLCVIVVNNRMRRNGKDSFAQPLTFSVSVMLENLDWRQTAQFRSILSNHCSTWACILKLLQYQ